MAKIFTINFTDAEFTRMVDAYATQYQTQVNDKDGGLIANPQSKQAFAKEQLLNDIKSKVRRAEEGEIVKNVKENVTDIKPIIT